MTSADEIDTTELEPGDRFEMPGGVLLTIRGFIPADESPETIGDSRYYEAELSGAPDTSLYGPHEIDSAIEGGAGYLGNVDVEETDPFVCEGCGWSAGGSARYTSSVPSLDADVCGYGCAIQVRKERRQQKMDDRTANH